MSKKDYGYVQSGNFKAYYPSDDVITGIILNARKLGLPSPYSEARDALNKIFREISRLRTDQGSEFPDLFNPLKKTMETIDQQGNLVPLNQPIETSEVSEEVVQTSALPSNINQDTLLTSTEEGLLSPWEKALRRKHRNVT